MRVGVLSLRTSARVLVAVLAGLLTLAHVCPAPPVVGYVDLPIVPGDNLIGNPLDNPDNHLNAVFTSSVPDGTRFSLWDPITRTYLPAATFHSALLWDINYDFPPGLGALVVAAEPFTATFVGTVLVDPSRLPDIYPLPVTPPADGLYLRSSLWPMDGRTFLDVVGRDPREGESVTSLDTLLQTYSTTSFTGGVWDNGDPTLGIARAAFYNLGPVTQGAAVPEPGSLGLLAVGVLAWSRRRAR